MDIEFAAYPFVAARHAAVVPTLTDCVDSKRRPVVVVGGGPVGMVTALGLANHGVPVVLIEADDSVCFGSRAICISRRSLEIIERLGAIDGFKRIGLPWTGGAKLLPRCGGAEIQHAARRKPKACADGQSCAVSHRTNFARSS